jgi:hypothetical protein
MSLITRVLIWLGTANIRDPIEREEDLTIAVGK